MEDANKVQVIKLIQNAGSNGIMIPAIKAQMPEVSLQEVRDIVQGLSDAGLVCFSSLRDTYSWNTEENRQQQEEGEYSRADQLIEYLRVNKNGAYYDDIAEAMGINTDYSQVIVSNLRKQKKIVTYPDPENHARRLVYLTEYAPKNPPELKIPSFVKNDTGKKKKTGKEKQEIPDQVFNIVPIKSKKLCQYIYDAIQEEGYGGTFNEVIECLLWMQVRDLISRGLLTKR